MYIVVVYWQVKEDSNDDSSDGDMVSDKSDECYGCREMNKTLVIIDTDEDDDDDTDLVISYLKAIFVDFDVTDSSWVIMPFE